MYRSILYFSANVYNIKYALTALVCWYPKNLTKIRPSVSEELNDKHTDTQTHGHQTESGPAPMGRFKTQTARYCSQFGLHEIVLYIPLNPVRDRTSKFAS
jgi:hypothetical protein